jgi:L-iditol 2-dehydrogenase
VRAAFMTGVGTVEVRDAGEPALDPRGALLRVEACGVCGTDARTFFNGDPAPPRPGSSATSRSASSSASGPTPSSRRG